MISRLRAHYIFRNRNRNYGVDLLRIVAMCMVVILHVLNFGGILEAAKGDPVKEGTAWFLEIAAYCAVDVYALLSGFVGYRSKHRPAGLAHLWLRVAFWSVILTLIEKLFFDPTVGRKKIMFAFFPLTNKGYWYFNMYFCLFLLLPLLNAGIERLSKRTLRLTVLSLVVCFSVLPFVWRKDLFKSEGGYSVIWLIVLYLIGAYIAKYQAFAHIKKAIAFLGYFLCITIVWCSRILIVQFFPSFSGVQNNEDWLVSYTSLPILLSAIFLLLIFRNLRLPAFLNKVIAVVSPLAFSVYIIHLHHLVSSVFLKDKFSDYALLSPPLMVLAVIGTAILFFAACAALDWIREIIFVILDVKGILQKAETKLLSAKVLFSEK
ncbi:MAG: acyltransferase family protein [Clostridia bacterium]|nr:acyltransferase family protein [Clostridia bacterium]